MGDQTLLVSRQEREANAKNQPMFRKRLFKDILIAISGSFRTGTSNTACCMMSSSLLPISLTIGKLRNRAQLNIIEYNVLSMYLHPAYVHTIDICSNTKTEANRICRDYTYFFTYSPIFVLC